MVGLLLAGLFVALAFVWPDVYDPNLTAVAWADRLVYWYGAWAVAEMIGGLLTFITIVGPLAFAILAIRNVLMSVACYIVANAYVGGEWNTQSLVFAGIFATFYVVTGVFRASGNSK